MTTTPSQKIFSGEPLPVPPEVQNPEVGAFYRKVIDYLRRLTGKLDRFNSGGGGPAGSALSTFAGIMTANQSMDTNYAAVEWTRELHKDACYDHSTSVDPEKIKVLCNGFYVVMADFEFSESATLPAEGNLRVTFNGSTETKAWSYGMVSAPGTLSRSVSLALKAEAIIDVQAKHSAASASVLLSRGTRITILKVSDDDSGWEEPTPEPPAYDCGSDCGDGDCDTPGADCAGTFPLGVGCPAVHSINATVLCGCYTREWGQCANDVCNGGDCTGGVERLLETAICCYEGGEEYHAYDDFESEAEAIAYCVADPTYSCFKSCETGACQNL